MNLLAPIVIVAAIGLWPVGRRVQLCLLGIVAIFALGLFPAGPLATTELAARDFQKRVGEVRTAVPEGHSGCGQPALTFLLAMCVRNPL